MSAGDGPHGAGDEPVTLAVVVPMFNEEKGAGKCVDSIAGVLATGPAGEFLVVVDDGSTDRTGELVEGLVARYVPRLRVVHHDRNLGYGAALRTGAATAQEFGANWVLFMDSDLTNPPNDIPRFREAARRSVDYVKGSRYASGGSVDGVPFGRRVISRTGNRFARALMSSSLSDLTNGFRAVRSRAFLSMPLRERGFPIIMEEAYWAHKMGLRVAEVPTVLTHREAGLRPSSFAYRWDVIWAYARYPVLALSERLQARFQRMLLGRPPEAPV